MIPCFLKQRITTNQKILLGSKMKTLKLEVKVGKHIRGQPYPLHDFSVLQELKVGNNAGVVACSDESLKTILENEMKKKPDQGVITYFYYEVSPVVEE